jgi:hypothetical protein
MFRVWHAENRTWELSPAWYRCRQRDNKDGEVTRAPRTYSTGLQIHPARHDVNPGECLVPFPFR